LEHHAADRLREGRVAHAVHHHLGHGRLAAGGLAAGFVIDGVSQAFELARALQGVADLERGRDAGVEMEPKLARSISGPVRPL
jgi:hypothetical protein